MDNAVVPAPVAAKLPELPEMPSKIPAALRFPLLVILSMAMSSFLYASASPFTSGDLSNISAQRDQWWEVAGLLGWRAFELAIAWWGGYDSKDAPRILHLQYTEVHPKLSTKVLSHS